MKKAKRSKGWLFFKPRRPSKWWPRDKRGRLRWVCVLKGGGWHVDKGDPMTAAQITEAKRLTRWEWPGATFRVETVQ